MGKASGRVKMKYSIIIPAYNAEKYIEKTLKKTLTVRGDSFEIVVVDDGSKDSTTEICDRYSLNYPEKVKVVHQRNEGQLCARINGIKAATGDYILFLDADDELSEDIFIKLTLLLNKYDNPDMIIYSFAYEYVNGISKPAKKITNEENFFEDKTELYKLFFTSTLLNNVWTKLVRRELLLKCEIDIEKYKCLRCSEDRLHSMEMITKADSIIYCPDPLYHYRIVDDSVTRSYSPDAIEKFNDTILYDTTKDYLEKWHLSDAEWIERMNASWADQVIYVFELFYTHCSDKKEILNYNWGLFLPVEANVNYKDNPFLNETKKEYLNWILNKDKNSIDSYIVKREFKKRIKSIFRR